MDLVQVTEYTNHWAVTLRCNSERGRDDAINPTSSAITVHVDSFATGMTENIKVADRH